MTCIVGMVDDGHVYLGGDSAGVGGYGLTIRTDEKVFLNGEFAMGFTSSFRMGQLLRYAFTPPKRNKKEIHAFMCTDFIDSVRKCLKDGGFAREKEQVEIGGTFLVGYQGNLFKIDSDYQVGRSAFGFDSCGSGDDLALGAMYESRNSLWEPQDRLSSALRAAATFNAGVSPPFNFVSI